MLQCMSEGRETRIKRRLWKPEEMHGMNLTQIQQCMEAYGKEVYAFCCRLTRNRQEAEDLYQDTFLTAMERMEQIDAQGNPKSWLISVCLRIWKNRKRKFAWRQRIAGERLYVEEADRPEAAADTPEEKLITEERHRQVRQAVERLEEKFRIPVYLYYTAELSVEEIGALLGIPAGTVKSRLYKARLLLRKELEDFDHD